MPNAENTPKTYTVALAGNPNVGKSTVFNQLTGMKQHTGNWTGKTVERAHGMYTWHEKNYILVDTPGTYSLDAHSPEEEITRDYIQSDDADVTVVVADATCLARNLILVLQILKCTKNVILCINLMDEAQKKGICIDREKLHEMLCIPIIYTGARSGKGLENLKGAIEIACVCAQTRTTKTPLTQETDCIAESERIFKACVTVPEGASASDRKIDKILTHPLWGSLSMLLLLFIVFYITMVGANYPSEFLQKLLFGLEEKLYLWCDFMPLRLQNLLIGGMYRTLAWVVSVMLPPMAIFFPLFTFLEDLGFLPRIAFNADDAFRRAGAHGKQCLTMCMGFGCNACGVTGCRIIDSPRERLIAILTNNFVPCNGRFPTIIVLISMFFTGALNGFKSGLLSGLLLTSAILLCIGMTLFMSYILSHSILRGETAGFVLELPPYRMPQIGKVLIHSLTDRTIFVLGRAAAVAAPAGAFIWALANIYVADMSLLMHISTFLNPFAKLFGMDGMILMAFLLGLPANEIVLPILLMGYMQTGTLTNFTSVTALKAVLLANGWSIKTALCVTLFSLFHFPCATTLLTVYKETRSFKWSVFAFILPTTVGLFLCFLVTNLL